MKRLRNWTCECDRTDCDERAITVRDDVTEVAVRKEYYSMRDYANANGLGPTRLVTCGRVPLDKPNLIYSGKVWTLYAKNPDPKKMDAFMYP